MDTYDFGLRLQTLRKQKGMSQTQVASELDVHKQTIYKYESNLALPPFDTIKKLARLYNCSIDYLAGFDENASVIYIDDFSEAQQEVIKQFLDDLRTTFRNY